MKKVLTIAGSDCSGGAGIQADIKTISAHKMYAMSVITSLTAQNTTGVFGILDVTPEFVAKQLDCIFTDIFPDSVKIGMVSNAEIIEVIAQKLKQYKAKNIVVDPVMISTSGSKLLTQEAMDSLVTTLLPLADIITPNIPEAETLCAMKIATTEDMFIAAQKISEKITGAVLVKGGHLQASADDLLLFQNKCVIYKGLKVDNLNTHGTGCTLSSAIACNLANGESLEISVKNAKEYVTGALNANLNLGKGSGPLNHMYKL
ncbi:MAG: bifunctional hydroxymethylpyrimidine kinase/phosphomethylpyrimidine kinase [Oscillospiraceae bacterium]